MDLDKHLVIGEDAAYKSVWKLSPGGILEQWNNGHFHVTIPFFQHANIPIESHLIL